MQLLDVAHTVPDADYPGLETLRKSYGWSDRNHRIFNRMFGLESTSLHKNRPLADTLRMSAQKLATANPALMGKVDIVIYCHALNASLPLHGDVLNTLTEEVFGCRPEILSMTQGSCASAIIAMEMMRHRQGNAPLNVVVLTGEKCFFELLNYAENNGLFGEATSAAWLRVGGSAADNGTTVRAVTTGHFDGIFAPVAKAGKEVAAKYDAEFMPRLTGAVTGVLDQAGLEPDDIDVILPTHLSPFTFNRVAVQLGMDQGRVRKDNLARIGHCFCGDLFINFKTWMDAEPTASRPRHLLSFAAGMTGSYAAIILRTESQP